MPDPAFPNRPDHPDFWLISEAVVNNDAQADSGQTAKDIISRYVDRDSMIYVAEMRALRMAQKADLPEIVQTALAAMWVDAFIAGARYQHLKTSEAQEDAPPQQRGVFLRCRCGRYVATSGADMDEHVAAMVDVDDGLNHGVR